MSRSLRLALSLGALSLAACGEEPLPTQPGAPTGPLSATLLQALASNSWTLRPPLPGFGFRGVAAGVAVNPAGQYVVYTFGGTNDEGGSGFPVQAYNVASDTWTTKAARVDVSHTNGVGRIGNRLYFSGGFDQNGPFPVPTPGVWAYDYAADRLDAQRPMPLRTAEGVSGVIKGRLYVLPGTCDTENWPSKGYCEVAPIRQLFRYNPATGIWAQMAPCPHFHARGAGGVIGDKFYVAGGSGGAFLDVYDPATDSWKTLAPMPAATPLAGNAGGAVLYDRLYVISETNTYFYNPATNLWRTRASSTWPHETVVTVRNASLDGKPHLFATGGSHEAFVPNDSELYTP